MNEMMMRIEVAKDTHKALKIRAIQEEKTLAGLISEILAAAVAVQDTPKAGGK